MVALAAKASGRPTHTWSNMSPENAKTRRLRKRAEARASAQAAKDSAAEAEVRDEQEAATGVATCVEEAQADVRRNEEKYEPAQAQAAGESEDDDNGEEEAIKFAFGFPSPKRGRKLSDEEQAETKRPRSPGRHDELQGGQHGAAATMEENTAVLDMMDKKSTHMFMEMGVLLAQMTGAHQVACPWGVSLTAHQNNSTERFP